MSQVVRETRTVDDGNDNVVDSVDSPLNIIAKIVYIIIGIIVGLLMIRFVLLLLGANPASGFANFIYDVTRPLAAPFFGLFNYEPVYGTARFELSSLIAIAVYVLIGWVIVKLLTVGTSRRVD